MRLRTVRTLTLTMVVVATMVAIASAQVPVEVRLVPTDVPIVTFAPGDKAMLLPGAHVFIPAQQQPDGTVTAGRVLVGKDGLVPPM